MGNLGSTVMPIIRENSGLITVIVTVDAPVTIMSEMESHARAGLRLFPEFEDFVSGALHKSADGGRLVQYLQWKTEENYFACMNDPRWDDLPSARRFLDHVDSGEARVNVRIYNVISVSGE